MEALQQRQATAPQRAPHTAWRRLGDEMVVIDLAANMVYGLDDGGGRVWEMLGEGREVAELAAAVVGDGDAACQAVASFVAELASLGLVDGWSGQSPPPPGSAPPSPRILWRERVQRFGGNCGLRPGQGTPCGGKPVWS